MDRQERLPEWHIRFTRLVLRQKSKLPTNVALRFYRLVTDLKEKGPYLTNWKSFGLLAKSKNIPINAYHCHIKIGRPTYVVCWQIVDKTIKILEVFYVGTHENAPY